MLVRFGRFARQAGMFNLFSMEALVAKKLYVGNLPFSTTEEAVRDLFAQFGEVHSVNIVADRVTGRPRGFGFVEMDNADAAIASLNNKDFEGRTLVVNEARPREPRSGGGGFGGGGGGGRRNRDTW